MRRAELSQVTTLCVDTSYKHMVRIRASFLVQVSSPISPNALSAVLHTLPLTKLLSFYFGTKHSGLYNLL